MIVFMMALLLVLILFGTLLLVYLFDINYFLRIAFVYLSAHFTKKRLDFLEPSITHGLVLPFDSDAQLLHMNNARVLREYDFSRVDYWDRVGLLDNFVKSPFSFFSFAINPVFQVAGVIRYRRPMHMFSKYKIITRAAYWEGKTLYHEHQMVTLKDNITRNVGYSKLIFPFSIDDFVKKRYPEVKKPAPRKDLELWIKYNAANSMNTRKSENATEEDTDDWTSTF